MRIIAYYNAQTGNIEDDIEMLFGIDIMPIIGMKIKVDNVFYTIEDVYYDYDKDILNASLKLVKKC